MAPSAIDDFLLCMSCLLQISKGLLQSARRSHNARTTSSVVAFLVNLCISSHKRTRMPFSFAVLLNLSLGLRKPGPAVHCACHAPWPHITAAFICEGENAETKIWPQATEPFISSPEALQLDTLRIDLPCLIGILKQTSTQLSCKL